MVINDGDDDCDDEREIERRAKSKSENPISRTEALTTIPEEGI